MRFPVSQSTPRTDDGDIAILAPDAGDAALDLPARRGWRCAGRNGRLSAVVQARSLAGPRATPATAPSRASVVGIPAGVFAVYRRFKGYFS